MGKKEDWSPNSPPSGEAPALAGRAKIVYGNQELLTEELNYISKAVY